MWKEVNYFKFIIKSVRESQPTVEYAWYVSSL